MPIDGGVVALSGYLYQTIVALGISALFENLSENPDPDNNELDQLVKLINVGQSEQLRIDSERYGEDVIIRRYGFSPADECVLVQVKFSRRPQDNPIQRNQLVEIIETFDRNVMIAEQAGVTVSACVLITNRSLTNRGPRSSQLLWKEERNNKDYRLEIIDNIPTELFLRQLKIFACKYGVLENEFERGLRQLIAIVIEEATQHELALNTGIFKGKLLQAFTGYRYTEALEIHDLQDKFTQGLQRYERSILIQQLNHHPIIRDILYDVLARLQERAFIGLYGLGGCGKSILLWQIIQSIRESSVFTVFFINDIFPNLIPTLVNRNWRNLPEEYAPNDSIQAAINRTCVANPDLVPVFILGIDGLDEDTNPIARGQHVKEIVEWFLRKDSENRQNGLRPKAVLIVTCREEDHLRTLLAIPKDSLEMMPIMIPVGPFNQNEVEAAFRCYLPRFIEDAEHFQLQFGGKLDLLPVSFVQSQILIDDQNLVNSLQHPAIWRALLGLNEETQQLAVQGDIKAKYQVANRFITWFEDKLNIRRINIHIEGDELRDLLSTIARNTQVDEPNPKQIWHEVASYRLGAQANTLFKEAVLAGLIEQQSSTHWNWKHKFIYEYLANRL